MRFCRAYTYDTGNPDYKGSEYACNMQSTEQWFALMNLFYKLGITVLY